MSGAIPALLRDLIDDAAVFPPGNAPLERAVPDHRGHRQSWYEPMIGPLLVPASRLTDLDPGRGPLDIGVIVDTDPEQVAGAVEALGRAFDGQVRAVHYESRAPLDRLRKAARSWDGPVYAELPTRDQDALDVDLDAVADTGFTPKFRTGGLTAELFPTPRALAAAIVGCASRGLRFKLTAGLHRAVRHRDRETGFVHHGFVNVLVAAIEAAGDADAHAVAETLASTSGDDLAERAGAALDRPRPLWTGYGSCSVAEPLDDLMSLSLLTRGGTE